MNPLDIIDKYYKAGALRDLLIRHSECVAQRALRIAFAHPELAIDTTFVSEAAMLHDIGIICCDAPDIHCHGTEPYIRHGVMGAQILLGEGLPLHARVCERHTGAGITIGEVLRQHLPLRVPVPVDAAEPYMPATVEETLVCYADKFYSKSHPDREKTIEQAVRSLRKFGDDGVTRFLHWAQLFEGYNYRQE